jgi:hypothetical protein
VPLEGVPLRIERLVGSAEAGVVGDQAPEARLPDRRYDPTPEERPRGLSVEHHHRGSFALVEVREPEIADGPVMRLELEFGELR